MDISQNKLSTATHHPSSLLLLPACPPLSSPLVYKDTADKSLRMRARLTSGCCERPQIQYFWCLDRFVDARFALKMPFRQKVLK